jgi:hypothetical protein
MRTKHALTSADVKKIIVACETGAAKNNWAVAISVLDDSGILLGFAPWTARRGFPAKFRSARPAPRP